MNNDLVSIIMLSHNSAQYVEESVRSVLAQTYTNWELLFVDDNSIDNTLTKMMELMDEARIKKENGIRIERIKVSRKVYERGVSVNRNGALNEAHGKWIAFLDVGDVWAPDKLEKQIRFMEEYDYAFSYTMFSYNNPHEKDQRTVMGGPDHIKGPDMLKCCWMGYLTVMYDRDKVGLMQVRGLEEANDYALWLLVAKKTDCHLMPECLASQMSGGGIWNRMLKSPKWMWRYESYRKIEGMSPLVSTYMTIRNLAYTAWKWRKYAKRI